MSERREQKSKMVKMQIAPISLWEAFLLAVHVRKVKDPILKLLSRKIRALAATKDRVQTLILGSSHAQMGYRANEGEFNLGAAYEDLYYTYELYDRYKDAPALENIVVFYSVFSQGSMLIRTRDARSCVVFKTVAGIDWEDVELAEAMKLNRLCRPFRRKAAQFLSSHPLQKDDFGNEYDYIPVRTPKASDRALAHLKNNDRDFDMTAWLVKLIEEAARRKQKVFIVIPPATSGYRAALPSGQSLFDNVRKAMSKFPDVRLLDFYGDIDFVDGDFIDWDHPSPAGAAKLTAKIRREMAQGR